jgi:hypothetical protein
LNSRDKEAKRKERKKARKGEACSRREKNESRFMISPIRVSIATQ